MIYSLELAIPVCWFSGCIITYAVVIILLELITGPRILFIAQKSVASCTKVCALRCISAYIPSALVLNHQRIPLEADICWWYHIPVLLPDWQIFPKKWRRILKILIVGNLSVFKTSYYWKFSLYIWFYFIHCPYILFSFAISLNTYVL